MNKPNKLLVKFFRVETGEFYNEIPLSNIDALKFTAKLNDIGVISFTFADDRYFNIQLDDFVEVYEYNDKTNTYQKIETYFIRYNKRYISGNKQRYVIGGVSLNHLLKRRILDVEADSLGAGGYVTLGGKAYTLMQHLAQQHMVVPSDNLRRFPLLNINILDANDLDAGIRERYITLLSAFQKLSEKGKADFRIVKQDSQTNTGQLTLELGTIGADKTYTTNYPNKPVTILSPELGFIINPSVEIDRKDEKNFIYLLGEGEGANQTIVKYSVNTVNDSIYNRVEFKEEMRNGDSEYFNFEIAITEALQLLQDNQRQIKFDYEINQDRVFLNLGDRITISWGDIRENVRVTEIDYTTSETNITKKISLKKKLL